MRRSLMRKMKRKKRRCKFKAKPYLFCKLRGSKKNPQISLISKQGL